MKLGDGVGVVLRATPHQAFWCIGTPIRCNSVPMAPSRMIISPLSNRSFSGCMGLCLL